MDKLIKTTQQQAVAAWIETLKEIRLESLSDALLTQSDNFQKALEEVQKLKLFVDSPEHILGSHLTKHGEVAEQVQVRFSNAERLFVGKNPSHDIDSVGRTDRADYLRWGQEIQSKFCNGAKTTFEHVCDHLKKYPSFLKEGGEYDIPKDQYNQLADIIKRGDSKRSSLVRSEETLYKNIKQWEKDNGVAFKDAVKPSVADYDEVQLNAVDKTIRKKEESLDQRNQVRKDEIVDEHKPTLQEGLKTTAISAGIEAAVNITLTVYNKLKSGKKIYEFESEDWKDVGIKGLEGGVKGGIRGGVLYYSTNFLEVPAPLANALVSVTFGVVEQANLLRQGKISEFEFLERSESLCFEVVVCTVASVAGQAIIPIPIIGTVVGNAAGNLLLGIVNSYLSEREQKLVNALRCECEEYVISLDAEYQQVIKEIDIRMSKFDSIIDLCLDDDINNQFMGSIELATFVGVPDDQILHSDSEIEDYFSE